MARGRFPQGPTRSRPVGKLHTFGRVCLRGGQKYFALPSLAAQLRAFIVPFTLHPQVAAKKNEQPGLVLASLVVVTWGFFPFCQVRFAPLTNRRPKSGEIVPSGHKLPWLPRPDGACLLDICVCRQNARAETNIPA